MFCGLELLETIDLKRYLVHRIEATKVRLPFIERGLPSHGGAIAREKQPVYSIFFLGCLHTSQAQPGTLKIGCEKPLHPAEIPGFGAPGHCEERAENVFAGIKESIPRTLDIDSGQESARQQDAKAKNQKEKTTKAPRAPPRRYPPTLFQGLWQSTYHPVLKLVRPPTSASRLGTKYLVGT